LKTFLLTLLSIFFISTQASAQTYAVRGTVHDAETNQPLPGAAVKIISLRDTTLIKGGVTNLEGAFLVGGIDSRGIRIEISSLGFATYKTTLRLEDRITDLGTLKLKTSSEVLTEVEVTGTQQRAVMKGDTTQFNADAYKTNPDATAEDLVKKMPGITIENGQITAQGEQVQWILVDGKPFFGNDPNAALKNLPANAVEKVEVFSRRTDQAQFTGVDDGEEQKAINIVTRPSFRNGWFGRGYGGYGTDNTYQAGGNLNHFKNDQRISVVGMSNNINQQNFGSQDLLGVVGNNANQQNQPRWMRGPSVQSDPNDFVVSDQSGINTTHSFGINFSDDWGTKVKLNASYFFNRTNNRNQQYLSRTSFVTDTTSQFYISDSKGSGLTNNHRFFLRMEYKPSAKNQFFFTPRANWQSNAQVSTTEAQTNGMLNVPLNASNNNFGSDITAYSVGGDLLWMHNMAKKGRNFSYRLESTAANSEGRTQLLAENYFFGTVEVRDSIAQNGYPNSNNLQFKNKLRYNEPLSETSQLQFDYDFDVTLDDNQRKTYNFDPDNGQVINLDTNLSNVFASTWMEHEPGITYRYNNNKGFMTGIGFDYQYAQLRSDLQFPRSGEINRTFTTVQPNMHLRWQINKEKTFGFFFRSYASAPSVRQLQDVVDNTNPLQLYVGNPALKQAFGNRIHLRYNKTQVQKGTSLSFYGWARNQSNYITNATLIVQKDTLITNDVLLKTGGQLTYPINIDGFWTAGGSLSYGFPFALVKSNVDLTTGLNYSRTPGLINYQENLSNTYGISQRVNFTSNFSPLLDFTFGVTANLNLVYNSLQPQLNNNFYLQTTSAGITYIFWDGLVLRTSVVHQWYAGLKEGFDQNFVLWNASIGKKFLKNKQAELSLMMFDILNQNQSINRTVTELFVQDSETLVLQQYIMLNFTYTFKHFKGDSETPQP
jgi:hypothetical protein